MSIQLSQVTHDYGATPALSDISLSINTGELVALIGPSGCGKTTLLKILGTRITPSQGEANLLGVNPAVVGTAEIQKLRTKIALIPQHLGLVPNVKVVRNVLNGGLGKVGLLKTIRQLAYINQREAARAYEILDRTGIGEKIYDRTDSLSGGQQQRVAVARALYQDPQIILADEPVSAIDPARARDTIQLLTELTREEGLTLVVSLHNLDLAREFFPRLIGLRQGKIAFDQSSDELSDVEFKQLYELEQT